MMRLKWLDTEENTMQWSIEGDWTGEEHLQTFENWKNLASNKPYVVDLILDMRLLGRMPSNALSLAWHTILQRPQNIGVTIIVSDHRLVRTLYKTMMQIYGTADSVILFSADWDGVMDMLQAAKNSRAAT